jgi:hypothetical protein
MRHADAVGLHQAVLGQIGPQVGTHHAGRVHAVAEGMQQIPHSPSVLSGAQRDQGVFAPGVSIIPNMPQMMV